MPMKILTESKGIQYYINLAKELTGRYLRHDIGQTGGQLAYFSLLSLFPFIIYINALITEIHIPIDRFLTLLTPILPYEIVSMIDSYINYISTISAAKVLSLGIITTLYSASRSVRSLERAINVAYGIKDKRKFIRSIILSMLVIIFLGIAIIITLLLSFVSRNLLANLFYYLGISQQTVNLIIALKWALIVAALFFTISGVYFFMPYKKMRFRSVIPGTVLSIFCYSLLSIGFSTYVDRVLKFSALYGSIGAVFLLLLWLYIAGIILVLGAELNCILE